MIVANAVGHLEVVGREEGDALVTPRDRNGPHDLQVFAGGSKRFHTRLMD